MFQDFMDFKIEYEGIRAPLKCKNIVRHLYGSVKPKPFKGSEDNALDAV